jgi:hypothetical protein
MEWLNYHHLDYLFAVARTGSISKLRGVTRLPPQSALTADTAEPVGRAKLGSDLWSSRLGNPYADAFLGNDATACSSLAYTVIALSSLVRRSNSVKYILEDTSLASPSRPPVPVKRRTRAARPVLSTRSTLVRLTTTLRFSDNSLWTLSQKAVVACPATS